MTPSPLRRFLRRCLPLAAIGVAGISGACAGPVQTRPATAIDSPGPDSFSIHFVTSRGPFDVRVHRNWAQRGADRIYSLAQLHFFDGVRFFRVVNGTNGRPFVAQWGLNGDTAVSREWRGRRLQDDKPDRSNVRGTLSFAAGGPNTRTTQMYVNFGDNSRLDATGFAVFGQVTAGMESVVDSLYKGYPTVPSQDSISRQGNAYLIRSFPKLDYIITARITQEWRRR